MNDEVIARILNYMDECLIDLEDTWPKEDFEKRSYSRWAAMEIVEALMGHPLTWAWTVIDEFIFKMLYFAHLAEDDNLQFTYAIAVAEDIQALLN